MYIFTKSGWKLECKLWGKKVALPTDLAE